MLLKKDVLPLFSGQGQYVILARVEYELIHVFNYLINKLFTSLECVTTIEIYSHLPCNIFNIFITRHFTLCS